MFTELRVLHPQSIYPDISGASMRTFNIAKLASSYFAKTTIYSVDEENEYNSNHCGINIIQEKKYGDPFSKYFLQLDRLCNPYYKLRCPTGAFHNGLQALFQIEEPYFYNLLRKKGIKKYILDEHNVYWNLSDSIPNFQLKYKIFNYLTRSRDKKIEIKAIEQSAHTLVCSEIDKDLIIKEIPKVSEKITVVPNCIDLSFYDNYRREHFREECILGEKKILFMGTFQYSPNIDAVKMICNDIAPEINGADFIIIGKNPPKISKPDNVHYLGYVPDVKKYLLESDVCIAPIRFGSGTRLKILEYMAMGKPVISTSKGAEGIDYSNNKNIIIADNPKVFSENIRILLDDKKLRDKLGKNAMDLIEQKYDWKIYRKTLHEIYDTCM